MDIKQALKAGIQESGTQAVVCLTEAFRKAGKGNFEFGDSRAAFMVQALGSLEEIGYTLVSTIVLPGKFEAPDTYAVLRKQAKRKRKPAEASETQA